MAAGTGRTCRQRAGQRSSLSRVGPKRRTTCNSASVESEDRAGDLVIARGWELESYLRNPVVLWAHQHRMPPIARSVEIAVEGDSLMATIEFADTPFAQEIKHLYLTGFMNGVSVGFRALEVESRKAVGGRRGTVFKRQELLEISAAPVPLHPLTLCRPPAAAGRTVRRSAGTAQRVGRPLEGSRAVGVEPHSAGASGAGRDGSEKA